ncbi:MAG: branched-chain amino acid ABC transporter permease [Beutenbergiaceae bacterium]
MISIVRKYPVRITLAAAGIILLFVLPYLTSSYVISVAGLALIAAILAGSVNLLAGNGGMVSVGHAGIAAAASYGVAWSHQNGYGYAAQLGIAILVTLVVSAIFGITSMRTQGIYFLMVTLALGMTVYGLAYRLSPITGGDNGISGIDRPPFAEQYWVFHWVVVAVFLLCLLGLWVVSVSPFGTVLRGIRDSESRMLSLGYQISNYKFVGMMISGFFAGIAGILSVWHSQFVSPPSAGFMRSALTLVMVVLGGLGTTLGPLIGATVVIWIEHVLSTDVERWPTLLGLVFVLVILFAPRGVMGAVSSVRRRLARGRGQPGESPPEPDTEPTQDSETASN